jgi:predicted AAA+ superfamily ATPase
VEKQGPRFENLVAGHLLKWVHYQQDVFGRDLELSYVRDSTGREVDFALSENGKVATLIECKKSDTEIDSSLKYFAKRFPEAEAIQLVQDLEPDAERVSGGIRLVPALSVLEKLV